MARFDGTLEEFHKFIGPRIRNLIQSKTKAHKRILGACQNCKKQTELEAAHRKGRERKAVIKRVLIRRGLDPEHLVIRNLAAMELSILEAHHPLEKSFLFLCRPCHKAYDAGLGVTHGKKNS